MKSSTGKYSNNIPVTVYGVQWVRDYRGHHLGTLRLAWAHQTMEVTCMRERGATRDSTKVNRCQVHSRITSK